jgi:NAD kinase
MARNDDQKIILIKRPTRIDGLRRRFNTDRMAKFYVEHSGGDFHDYETEHGKYYGAVAEAERVAGQEGKLQVLEREHVPNFQFDGNEIVVVIGQDGLVANCLKYLSAQPVIGVNPEPERWDGVLVPFLVAGLRDILKNVMTGRFRSRQVQMAEVTLNDGQTLFAVNDFFIGQRTHVSARYLLKQKERQERQSSSGIIVSTGLGSTGWMKSILAGAQVITSTKLTPPALTWESPQLFFAVREPFPSRSSGATLVAGYVTRDRPLQITSLMAENGVIFSDGIESDFLQFNSGSIATVQPANRKGVLVVG